MGDFWVWLENFGTYAILHICRGLIVWKTTIFLLGYQQAEQKTQIQGFEKKCH